MWAVGRRAIRRFVAKAKLPQFVGAGGGSRRGSGVCEGTVTRHGSKTREMGRIEETRW